MKSNSYLYVVLLFPLVMTMLVLTAQNVNATFANEWGEYMDSPLNIGFVGDEVGQWASNGSYSTITDGTDFSPLALDLDLDGTMEIIGSDGEYLKIWGVSTTNSLSLQDELLMTGTQRSAMSALPAGYDGDDFTEIIAVFNTSNVTVLEYNGTSINIECWNDTNGNVTTGITCGNVSGFIVCYWATDDGNVTEFYAETCTVESHSVSANDIFTTTHGLKQAPVIADFYRDGTNQVIFGCDSSADNTEDICMFDTATNSLETDFDGDGVLELSTAGASLEVLAGFLVYNLGGTINSYDQCVTDCKTAYPLWWLAYFVNPVEAYRYSACKIDCFNQQINANYGGGNPEIVYTYYGTGGGFADQDTFMAAVRGDGTPQWDVTVRNDGTAGADYYISPPLIMGTLFNDDDSKHYICSVTHLDRADDWTDINCYDEEGTQYYSELNIPVSIWANGITLATADMNSVDDNNFDLVLGGGILILDLDTNTSTQIPYQDNMTNGRALNPILVDANFDHNLDVCGMNAGNVFCAYSPYDNRPPTLYNNASYANYGYNLDIDRPICVNDTVTFWAQECGGTSTRCNYDNDMNEDLERIVSNCGQTIAGLPNTVFTTNLVNGSFEGSTINNYTCFYNNTGTYQVRLYLQDDANRADFTVYNTQTMTLQIIEGTRGLDCSFLIAQEPGQADLVTAQTQEQQAVDDSIDSTLGILFGTSVRMRLIVGLAIIIGVIMLAVMQGVKNGIAILGIGMISLIMVTFIGLVSAYILILVLIALVLLVIVSKFVTGSDSGS